MPKSYIREIVVEKIIVGSIIRGNEQYQKKVKNSFLVQVDSNHGLHTFLQVVRITAHYCIRHLMYQILTFFLIALHHHYMSICLRDLRSGGHRCL